MRGRALVANWPSYRGRVRQHRMHARFAVDSITMIESPRDEPVCHQHPLSCRVNGRSRVRLSILSLALSLTLRRAYVTCDDMSMW